MKLYCNQFGDWLPGRWIHLAGWILAFMLLMLLPTPAVQAETDSGKVYLLIVDKMSVYDLDDQVTPEMNKLVTEGGIGLASSRTLRGKNSLDTSLTMGAGNIGRVYGTGIYAFNQNEYLHDRGQSAGFLYKYLTGTDPGEAACLLVNLPEISTGIAEEKVTTMPGAMGEVLRNNGRTVCILGNSDTGSEKLRASMVIAMDARGQVPLGDIGPNTVIPSTNSFLSHETNYKYILDKVDYFKSETDVFVIELSDLVRLENSDRAFPDIAQAEKQRRLKMIDVFVGQIAKRIDPARDLILVVTPSPSREQVAAKDTFTPIIAWGKGFTAGGLTSAATQRQMVVANTDLAPTVLAFFGLKDETGTMVGRPMKVEYQDGGALSEVQEFTSKTSTVNRIRVPLIKGYVILQIIVILLALVALFWLVELEGLVRPAVVALVIVPIIYMFLGLLPLSADWMYIAAAVIATIIATFVFMRLTNGNGYDAFTIAVALTVIIINLDLMTGAHLIQSSVLGYDPMAGARYYGIGNEFMGILLGSTIALAGSAYQKYPQRIWLIVVAMLFASQALMIASPHWGANSDGMLTAPAAFFITLILLGDLKIRPATILFVIGLTFLAAAGFTIYDMGRPVELQTHIGRAANQIMAGGWNEGWIIITRKLGMNIKLIRYTIWSWVFMVMLVVLSLLVYRPVGAMKELRQRKPFIVKSFGGIITGALIGLVVNDSGIVAASTTSIYLIVPILILMLYHQSNQTTDGAEDE